MLETFVHAMIRARALRVIDDLDVLSVGDGVVVARDTTVIDDSPRATSIFACAYRRAQNTFSTSCVHRSTTARALTCSDAQVPPPSTSGRRKPARASSFARGEPTLPRPPPLSQPDIAPLNFHFCDVARRLSSPPILRKPSGERAVWCVWCASAHKPQKFSCNILCALSMPNLDRIPDLDRQ